MAQIINDEEIEADYGILHHEEGREEIEEHGGIFGIEKEDWMRERSLDRESDMEQENVKKNQREM